MDEEGERRGKWREVFQDRETEMGTRCWIGFFHLNLQSWNKIRRFLKIYSSEFDLAPKLCSRSATGKRAFQLKKRVPGCYAESTIERSPGVRKTSGSQRFSTKRGGKNISLHEDITAKRSSISGLMQRS